MKKRLILLTLAVFVLSSLFSSIAELPSSSVLEMHLHLNMEKYQIGFKESADSLSDIASKDIELSIVGDSFDLSFKDEFYFYYKVLTSSELIGEISAEPFYLNGDITPTADNKRIDYKITLTTLNNSWNGSDPSHSSFDTKDTSTALSSFVLNPNKANGERSIYSEGICKVTVEPLDSALLKSKSSGDYKTNLTLTVKGK